MLFNIKKKVNKKCVGVLIGITSNRAENLSDQHSQSPEHARVLLLFLDTYNKILRYVMQIAQMECIGSTT